MNEDMRFIIKKSQFKFGWGKFKPIKKENKTYAYICNCFYREDIIPLWKKIGDNNRNK